MDYIIELQDVYRKSLDDSIANSIEIKTNEIFLPESLELMERTFFHRILTMFTNVRRFNAGYYPLRDNGDGEYSPLGVGIEDIISDLKVVGNVVGEFRHSSSYVSMEGSDHVSFPLGFLVYSFEEGNKELYDYFLLIENKCYRLNNCSKHIHLLGDMIGKQLVVPRKIFGEDVTWYSSSESLLELIYEFHDDYSDFMEEVVLYEVE